MPPQARYLVIPDLQIPFEHEDALKFCLRLKREYRIPEDNILCVGDEVDHYFGSLYAKDPDATHSPLSELKATKDAVKRWAKAFPIMRLAESNHGQRWAKRAAEAQIPSQMLRRYQEVLETPDTWKWARRWKITGIAHPFQMVHGIEFSGKHPYRQAAEVEALSTVFGHLTQAGIAHVENENFKAWGMCVSALIDRDAYAFHYSTYNRYKAPLGAGVILNDGALPIWHPLG